MDVAIATRGEQVFTETVAQEAFYAGAHGVLQMLAFLLERGDYEGLHRVIERHGRHIRRC